MWNMKSELYHRAWDLVAHLILKLQPMYNEEYFRSTYPL